MIAGQSAPPMMDMTSSDDPSFVYGPRLFRLKAKIVGNMMEWKKPMKTTAQMGASPEVLIASRMEMRAPAAKIESRRGAEIIFITADPAKRPIMNPSRWNFR